MLQGSHGLTAGPVQLTLSDPLVLVSFILGTGALQDEAGD